MIEIQQAVILAGGRGTRLRPFSDTAPKAMYPFEGKPFLEYLICQVRSFGIVDIVLVSVFCSLSASLGDMAISLLLVHFLFPMTVTACICFGVLCSRYPFSESAAIALCLLWSLAWILLILNENIYTLITPPLWLALLGTALGFSGTAITAQKNWCCGFVGMCLYIAW